MTALKEYQRLECTGLWREGAGAQKVEVIVSFGDATLVISDARNNRALTHWSLPAIRRLNPGTRPALFAPAEEAEEELELDDEAMIAAIAKVHRLIKARRPHPGRLRMGLVTGLIAAMVGAALLWLPAALVGHTANALPQAKRFEIGLSLKDELARVTGQPCRAPEGLDALTRLGARVLGPDAALFVVPDAIDRAVALPGGIYLLSRQFVETAPAPEVVAGALLAASAAADLSDPVKAPLSHSGFWSNLRLLTSGALPADALRGYGEVLIAAQPARPDDAVLLPRFAAAGIPSSPYAWAIDPSGESVLGLIEADSARDTPKPELVLTDGDWVALQGICEG